MPQIWPSTRTAPDEDDGRYLLLDEPTNNLDLAHQQAIMVTARCLSAKGLGVLAVVHDPNLAAIYADRIYILCDGAVTAAGSPETVFTQDLLQGTFRVSLKVMRHPEHGRPFILPA